MTRDVIRPIVGVAVLAVLLPSAAAASTVSVRFEHVVDRSGSGTLARIAYRARPGERNRLVVRFRRRGAIVRDRAGISAGPGCTRQSRTRVRCRVADAVRLRGSLGDRDDRAMVGGRLPVGDLEAFALVSIAGGAGADRLTHVGTGSAELSGGGGDDRLRRTRAGFTTFRGGLGNDSMIGGPGQERFVEGREANGADTMVAGASGRAVRDTVDYGGRREAVHADLEGDRDDGAPGENDQIATDVEALVGGSGPDRLIGSAADNELTGNEGSDMLWGGEGDDALYAGQYNTIGGREPDQVIGGPGDDQLLGSGLLDAGPGRDVVTGGLGADRILARDDATDRVACEEGEDEIELDALDWFGEADLHNVCERVTRIGSPVAVLVGLNPPMTHIPVRRDRPVAVPEFGCPADAVAACTADVRLLVGNTVVGATAIVVPVGEVEYRPFRVARKIWRRAIRPVGDEVAATMVLAARDQSGGVVEQSIPVTID